MRLVAGGLASPRAVKTAAIAAFAVAAAAGTALALAVGPVLFLVGALAIAAGWLYTGGPKPYGYYGFGELFVFVFFGLVATAGTTYVLVERLTWLSVVAAVPVGFLACALLVVNNLRDIPTDRQSGDASRSTSRSHAVTVSSPTVTLSGRSGRGTRTPAADSTEASSMAAAADPVTRPTRSTTSPAAKMPFIPTRSSSK